MVLSVTLDAGNSDSVDLHFSVRDTGIGIAPENIDHIFDGFSQAEASTARRFGGTGLGLAISQRLVQLMGGLLRVTSTPGRGSTFEFTITLGRTPQQSVREMNHALQYLRCLVVDDSPTGRDVLAAIVRSFGWRAEGVASGEEALAAVGTRPYDVVLMDWRMPGIDGWETSVRLRRQVPTALAPLVIMVTAHERELIAQTKGQFSPVLDAMLAKPVTASLLFDTVTELRLATRRQAGGSGSAPAGCRCFGRVRASRCAPGLACACWWSTTMRSTCRWRANCWPPAARRSRWPTAARRQSMPCATGAASSTCC
ncbi:response regulator [Massilia sp. B-10]|nr:response regulator [Massilia sp. B-10]